VVDVNSNRANPVINSRSFGENKYRVAEKGIAYMKALQNNGVMACAKHFPGHGDTDTDSHKALPVINHSFEMIDTLDLYPFKQLFLNNVAGTMVAHLHIPAIDTSKNSTSTLSSAVVTDLLKGKLKFKGLVFTDAMDMSGISKFNKPGVGELKAVSAGNDIILLPQNLPEALSAIQQAIDSCFLCQDDIDSTCRKILIFKHKFGLGNIKPVKIDQLYERPEHPTSTASSKKVV
jgi:beta-N-acetylhexosaminidase